MKRCRLDIIIGEDETEDRCADLTFAREILIAFMIFLLCSIAQVYHYLMSFQPWVWLGYEDFNTPPFSSRWWKIQWSGWRGFKFLNATGRRRTWPAPSTEHHLHWPQCDLGRGLELHDHWSVCALGPACSCPLLTTNRWRMWWRVVMVLAGQRWGEAAAEYGRPYLVVFASSLPEMQWYSSRGYLLILTQPMLVSVVPR